jgi:hypothetical protein
MIKTATTEEMLEHLSSAPDMGSTITIVEQFHTVDMEGDLIPHLNLLRCDKDDQGNYIPRFMQ